MCAVKIMNGHGEDYIAKLYMAHIFFTLIPKQRKFKKYGIFIATINVGRQI